MKPIIGGPIKKPKKLILVTIVKAIPGGTFLMFPAALKIIGTTLETPNPTIIKANIYAVEPQVSLNTRTLTVRARATNDQGKLKVGSFVNVIVPIEVENDAISIPTEAIVPVQDGKKVFVLQHGLAKEVKVETGARTDKDIVILSGISAGDTVLTTGVLSLKDGAKVKVSLAN